MTGSDRSSEDLLLREDRDGVATLTLNRPQARNALSLGLLEALREAFAGLSQDDSVRAVVLAASGPAFCAGHDLKEMTGYRAESDRGAKSSKSCSLCARA